nr:trihelix transcription factor ASR3 [Tanacetum cinerariifolium]
MDDHETGNTSSLRTRSKAAPDWTVEESLILVNEIAAIEADCRGTLSSFQKWKIIVENCNALEVNRNLNQCRRKWDSLLSDYKKIKLSGSKKASFNSDLFKAIERYVREFEEEGEYDTDPEGDDDDNHDDGMDLPLAHVMHFGIGISAGFGGLSVFNRETLRPMAFGLVVCDWPTNQKVLVSSLVENISELGGIVMVEKSFNDQLFKAIERHVREYEGGGGDNYTDPAEDGMDLPLADAVYFGMSY